MKSSASAARRRGLDLGARWRPRARRRCSRTPSRRRRASPAARPRCSRAGRPVHSPGRPRRRSARAPRTGRRSAGAAARPSTCPPRSARRARAPRRGRPRDRRRAAPRPRRSGYVNRTSSKRSRRGGGRPGSGSAGSATDGSSSRNSITRSAEAEAAYSPVVSRPIPRIGLNSFDRYARKTSRPPSDSAPCASFTCRSPSRAARPSSSISVDERPERRAQPRRGHLRAERREVLLVEARRLGRLAAVGLDEGHVREALLGDGPDRPRPPPLLARRALEQLRRPLRGDVEERRDDSAIEREVPLQPEQRADEERDPQRVAQRVRDPGEDEATRSPGCRRSGATGRRRAGGPRRSRAAGAAGGRRSVRAGRAGSARSPTSTARRRRS